MRHLVTRFAWVLSLLILAACSSASAPSRSVTYTDPFAYCAAAGTIDAPDQRYTGPAVPTVIALGLRSAFGMPKTADLEPFLRNTSWRCMGGKVYACTVGANLPCGERADTRRVPSQAMLDYCKANPDAANIPAVVTGRATVYLWRCRSGSPQVVRQITEPDARGFLSNVWYEIAPRSGVNTPAPSSDAR